MVTLVCSAWMCPCSPLLQGPQTLWLVPPLPQPRSHQQVAAVSIPAHSAHMLRSIPPASVAGRWRNFSSVLLVLFCCGWILQSINFTFIFEDLFSWVQKSRFLGFILSTLDQLYSTIFLCLFPLRLFTSLLPSPVSWGSDCGVPWAPGSVGQSCRGLPAVLSPELARALSLLSVTQLHMSQVLVHLSYFSNCVLLKLQFDIFEQNSLWCHWSCHLLLLKLPGDS